MKCPLDDCNNPGVQEYAGLCVRCAQTDLISSGSTENARTRCAKPQCPNPASPGMRGRCDECSSPTQSGRAKLCSVGGCGFFGDPLCDDLCSQCYKQRLEQVMRTPETIEAGGPRLLRPNSEPFVCPTENCHFFGNEDCNGFCSKCFEKQMVDKRTKRTPQLRPHSIPPRRSQTGTPCCGDACPFFGSPSRQGYCTKCYQMLACQSGDSNAEGSPQAPGARLPPQPRAESLGFADVTDSSPKPEDRHPLPGSNTFVAGEKHNQAENQLCIIMNCTFYGNPAYGGRCYQCLLDYTMVTCSSSGLKDGNVDHLKYASSPNLTKLEHEGYSGQSCCQHWGCRAVVLGKDGLFCKRHSHGHRDKTHDLSTAQSLSHISDSSDHEIHQVSQPPVKLCAIKGCKAPRQFSNYPYCLLHLQQNLDKGETVHKCEETEQQNDADLPVNLNGKYMIHTDVVLSSNNGTPSQAQTKSQNMHGVEPVNQVTPLAKLHDRPVGLKVESIQQQDNQPMASSEVELSLTSLSACQAMGCRKPVLNTINKLCEDHCRKMEHGVILTKPTDRVKPLPPLPLPPGGLEIENASFSGDLSIFGLPKSTNIDNPTANVRSNEYPYASFISTKNGNAGIPSSNTHQAGVPSLEACDHKTRSHLEPDENNGSMEDIYGDSNTMEGTEVKERYETAKNIELEAQPKDIIGMHHPKLTKQHSKLGRSYSEESDIYSENVPSLDGGSLQRNSSTEVASLPYDETKSMEEATINIRCGVPGCAKPHEKYNSGNTMCESCVSANEFYLDKLRRGFLQRSEIDSNLRNADTTFAQPIKSSANECTSKSEQAGTQEKITQQSNRTRCIQPSCPNQQDWSNNLGFCNSCFRGKPLLVSAPGSAVLCCVTKCRNRRGDNMYNMCEPCLNAVQYAAQLNQPEGARVRPGLMEQIYGSAMHVGTALNDTTAAVAEAVQKVSQVLMPQLESSGDHELHQCQKKGCKNNAKQYGLCEECYNWVIGLFARVSIEQSLKKGVAQVELESEQIRNRNLENGDLLKQLTEMLSEWTLEQGPTVDKSITQSQSGPPTGFPTPESKPLDTHSLPGGPSQLEPSQFIDEEPRSLMPQYSLDCRPRGYALIIANQNFPTNARDGSHKDVENLVPLFEKLHFIVEIYPDNTALEMHAVLTSYSRKDHTDYDCFCCIILTHGGNGVVYGTDGIPVPILDVTTYFKDDKCPTLKDKPRLFFIQACQGSVQSRSVPAGLNTMTMPPGERANGVVPFTASTQCHLPAREVRLGHTARRDNCNISASKRDGKEEDSVLPGEQVSEDKSGSPVLEDPASEDSEDSEWCLITKEDALDEEAVTSEKPASSSPLQKIWSWTRAFSLPAMAARLDSGSLGDHDEEVEDVPQLTSLDGTFSLNGYLMDANAGNTSDPLLVPDAEHFLISYACLPGRAAFRDPARGSAYILALIENLQKYGSTMDVQNVLRRVSRQVRVKYEQFTLEEQLPFFVATMWKELYLSK